MINNSHDLHSCLNRDLGRYYHPLFFIWKSINLWLRGSEYLPMWNTLYTLRFYEYYLNKLHLSIWEKVKKQFWRFIFRRCQLNYDLYIEPNTLGPGVTIMHPGFRKIPDFVSIGMNCTILPLVLIGKKKPNTNVKAIIGDNCYISTGVTILAPVKIGNNVIIGAGAVVTKDVPDACVIAGVPAKIIK